MFSGRNQSIGCAVAWVTKTRDSEYEYPFYLLGQFCRIWAGHLSSPFHKVGRLCDNCLLNHSTVFTDGCDWTNVGHPVCLLKTILIDSNLPVICWHPWSFIVVVTAPKTLIWIMIWQKVSALNENNVDHAIAFTICSGKLFQYGSTRTLKACWRRLVLNCCCLTLKAQLRRPERVGPTITVSHGTSRWSCVISSV